MRLGVLVAILGETPALRDGACLPRREKAEKLPAPAENRNDQRPPTARHGRQR